jgi:hypothetical protein
MRPNGRIIQAGLFLAVTLLFVATRGTSQAPTTQVWEYASVESNPEPNIVTSEFGNSTRASNSAKICYASADGCRIEDVTTTSQKALPRGEAIMMAAAKLGEQGWQLTSSTEALSNYRPTERVLYFRRLKTDAN